MVILEQEGGISLERLSLRQPVRVGEEILERDSQGFCTAWVYYKDDVLRDFPYGELVDGLTGKETRVKTSLYRPVRRGSA